jgi:ABC-type uncharacterized transport system substrate-binding protein
MTAVVLLFYAMTSAGCTPAKSEPGIKVQKQAGTEARPEAPRKKYKVLHIMSYHSPWEWTDSQFDGFKDSLKDLDVEYRVFQLDAKNRSSQERLKKAGQEAMTLIDTWRPDLVYASDDEAIHYVAARYHTARVPFVFSGVNQSPQDYGISPNQNITGVLEIEHFVESARLFKKIVPGAKRIAVVFDDAPLWSQVAQRMQERLGDIADLEFVAWDTIGTFAEYKRKIREYQSTVDGICLVGIFNFKDENGDNVHYRQVLKWTAENSRLPDFSFWSDRVNYGTLCAVSVSGYEQGLAAGAIAREILANGKSPASFALQATTKGQAGISLARAKALGLKVDSRTLLSSKVFERYGWEQS